MLLAWSRCIKGRIAIDGMMLALCRRCPRHVLAYTVMKQLLLVTFIAVACEAAAQDAQCVPERAAMVETIRAYARFEAGVLGPQGISERVLEAVGKTERHRFIQERSCSVAYMDAPVLIGHDQTISQPFIVALMTRHRSARPAVSAAASPDLHELPLYVRVSASQLCQNVLLDGDLKVALTARPALYRTNPFVPL
jgi:hypothetical protein